MKTITLIFTLLLLLLNGVGALAGGYHLISDPTGRSLQLPFEYIEQTIFLDYFIPGIVLFTCNGLFSIFTFFLVVIKHLHAGKFIMLQGLILMTWIVVQLLMIKVYFVLQTVFFATGLLLLICGWFYSHSPSLTPRKG